MESATIQLILRLSLFLSRSLCVCSKELSQEHNFWWAQEEFCRIEQRRVLTEFFRKNLFLHSSHPMGACFFKLHHSAFILYMSHSVFPLPSEWVFSNLFWDEQPTVLALKGMLCNGVGEGWLNCWASSGGGPEALTISRCWHHQKRHSHPQPNGEGRCLQHWQWAMRCKISQLLALLPSRPSTCATCASCSWKSLPDPHSKTFVSKTFVCLLLPSKDGKV